MEGTRKRGRPVQDGEMRLRGLKNNRNKKQAGNGQRQSGMEEDYIGSQGQQTVAPEEEEVEEEHMEEYYGKVSKHERLSGINLPWKTQNIQERHTLKYHTI